MSGPIPYIGSRISLISKSEIRYEGILYTIDTKESTVALQSVRSFGTEGRKPNAEIAASNEVYDYIIFRGADIKDLHVCEPPSRPQDPAIINAMPHQTQGHPGYPYGPAPGQWGPPNMGVPPYPGYPYGYPPSYFGAPNANFPGQKPPAQANQNPQAAGQAQAGQAQAGQASSSAQPQAAQPQAASSQGQQSQPATPASAPNPSQPSTQSPAAATAPAQGHHQARNQAHHNQAQHDQKHPEAEAKDNAAPKGQQQATGAQQQDKTAKAAKTKPTAASVAAAPKPAATAPSHPPKQAAKSKAKAAAAPPPSSPVPLATPPSQGPALVPTPLMPPVNPGPTSTTVYSAGNTQRNHQRPNPRYQAHHGEHNNHHHHHHHNAEFGDQSHSYRGGRRPQQRFPNTPATPKTLEEFDFESANARFNKSEIAEEIKKQETKDVPVETETNVEGAGPLPSLPKKAYDKTSSFFDNLSCESLDKTDEDGEKNSGGSRGRGGRSFVEQRKLDTETFGPGPQRGAYHRGGQYNRGGRGGGPRRYQQPGGNFTHGSNGPHHGPRTQAPRSYRQPNQSAGGPTKPNPALKPTPTT